METTTPHVPPSNGERARATATSPVPRSLDELLDLDATALDALYHEATAPRLGDVAGDLRGRLLASPLTRSLPAVAGWLRAFAGSDRFPWRGKTFTPMTETRGEGVNRVVRDRWRLFRFTTSIGPSRAGAFDALQLDYDQPGNPFFIRRIQDELRELRPGLYLGQMWLNIGSQPRLGLYFGLESTPAHDLGFGAGRVEGSRG